MNALKTVLCAADLAADTDEVLRQAHAVARLYGSRLVVFHAVPNAMRSAPLFPHLALQDNARFVELERKVLEALAARVTSATGRPQGELEVLLGFGAPHTAIIEAAEQVGADLVVVGAGGSTAAARAVLGATAERVVRYAHCAVWVARPALLQGRVLAATDFSDPAYPALELAADYARRSGSDLTAMHALALPKMLVPMGMPTEMPAFPMWTQADITHMREASATRLTDALKGLGATADAVVEDGLAATAILDTAGKCHARLICLGTRGRTGLARVALGSVAEEVVRRAAGPVLVARLNPAP